MVAPGMTHSRLFLALKDGEKDLCSILRSSEPAFGISPPEEGDAGPPPLKDAAGGGTGLSLLNLVTWQFDAVHQERSMCALSCQNRP